MAKIYLDFNVYINMAKIPEFKKLIMKLKDEHEIVYAFPIAEELYKNKDTFYAEKIPEIIKLVSEVTNDNIVGPTEKGDFCFAKRKFKFEYMNCSLFPTQGYVEDCGVRNEKLFQIEEVEKDEKSRISGLSPKSLWNDAKVHKKFKRFGLPINPKNVKSLEFAIPFLSQLLASVGYAEEKNTQTYISGVYDDTHLIYASQCDYFVTSDKNCFKKAEAIFEKIGVGARAIKLSNPEKVPMEKIEMELRKIKSKNDGEMEK